MKVDRPDEETVEDPLPEGTETVVWVAGGDFRLRNCSEYDEDIFPDDVDLSPVKGRSGRETDPTIIYDPGDELPLPVARDIWPSFNDRMAAFDVDDRRLDERGGNEDRAALEQWRGVHSIQ